MGTGQAYEGDIVMGDCPYCDGEGFERDDFIEF